MTVMPDWKQPAAEIPSAQLDAITPALNTLEALFHPLTATITAEDVPATVFSAFPEENR
jgi:hypothetical protein